MSVVEREPPTGLRPGQFVTATSNKLGVGKLLRYGSRCEVEYFNAVSEAARIRMEIPRREIRFAPISPGTPCYWRSGLRWRAGHVEAIAGVKCRVGTRDGESQSMSLTEVFVRGDMPVEDPSELLRAGITTSEADHSARHRWITSSLEQRAASRGLDGIGSAAARLHVYQLEVARQVLVDPVQRFLLGDEVGLGKTIEAGFVIRQLVVEDPRARVKVLAPSTLIPQWLDELTSKFGIDQFAEADLTLQPLERPKEWADASALDLLVVDEAHKATGDPSQPMFQALHPLAHRTPRLLLLSATPALNHERAFLGLLHLLEPAIYPLDDLAGFKSRLERRAELSQIILTFAADQPDFHLRSAIRRLVERFPDDLRLADLAARIEPVLAPGAEVDASIRTAAIRTVAVHVGETYRLHRRLLRTRRTEAAETGGLVRGRTNPQEVATDDDRMGKAHDLVDAWRAVLAEVGEDLGRVPEAALLCPTVFARAGGDPTLLMALCRYRLSRDESHARDALLAGKPAQRVANFPLVDEERTVLIDLVALLEGLASGEPWPRRLAATVDAACDGGDAKTVIFTDYEPTAIRLAEAIGERLGDEAVAHVARARATDDRAHALARFRTDPECSILIAGNVAQEGVNLEFADRLIHVDLPWVPNRLEQRIGRLDRYATAAPFHSVVILDGGQATTFADAWFRCLRDGFRVFERSIASFQFVLDAITTELRRRVLIEGVEGLLAATDELPARLEDELSEIEERESLDSLHVGAEATRLFDGLRLADERADGLLAALDPAKGLAGVQRVRELSNPRVFRLQGDALDAGSRGLSERRLSVHREEALLEPEVELFRPGHPVYEALDRGISSGDRGRAFAIQCPAESIEEEAMYWRFDFIVEVDAKSLGGLLGGELQDLESALRRRIASYLPQQLLTIWLDASLNVVDDNLNLQQLQMDSQGRDLDLGGPWPLDGFVEEKDWERTFAAAQAVAEKAATLRPEFSGVVTDALEAARRGLADATDQAAARRNANPDDRSSFNDEAEIVIRRGVIEALKHPTARLDSLGVVVLVPGSKP